MEISNFKLLFIIYFNNLIIMHNIQIIENVDIFCTI